MQKDEEFRNTQLFAPMDGNVLEILNCEGESVSPFLREPVLLFADLSKYRIRAEIDEQYVHQVKPGQKATVSNSRSNRCTAGHFASRPAPSPSRLEFPKSWHSGGRDLPKSTNLGKINFPPFPPLQTGSTKLYPARVLTRYPASASG